MLKFKYVHLYGNQTNTLDLVNIVVPEVQKYFPSIIIDLRRPVLSNIDEIIAEALVSIRISNIMKPFSRQLEKEACHRPRLEDLVYEIRFPWTPASSNTYPHIGTFEDAYYKELILYDGFMMQRLLRTMINENETNTDHVHIIFEDRLVCTFSDEDWRYHARTIVSGVPSIISTTGIIEAPARPKEWYIKRMELAACDLRKDNECESSNEERLAMNKYLKYGDKRINFIVTGFVLQILFFFITEGDPFCTDIGCRLYNAHWQEELIYSQLKAGNLCDKHYGLLQQFNTASIEYE
jgi:putative metallopeptidase DUF6775